MPWIKRFYGSRASEKRYRILVSPEGRLTAVPVGGAPIYSYQSSWVEVVRVNRTLPNADEVQGAYLALLRALRNKGSRV